jgi:phage recombination protein Bet
MNKPIANNLSPAPLVQNETAVEFIPIGLETTIKLSAAMVSNFIAVPTKSGRLPSVRDCVKFIMLCKGKRANPFEGDCYLIGYDNNKTGEATFSLVCGIELFLKRAENNDQFDGVEYGVIVSDAEGVQERQGTLVFDGENLLGGWAKVYRKDKSRCYYKAVKFSTYNSGYSRWEKDPSGMISKVALSQALREAFPTALGGLYTQEEMQKVTESGDGIASIKEPIKMPVEIPEPPKPELKIDDNELPFTDDDSMNKLEQGKLNLK